MSKGRRNRDGRPGVWRRAGRPGGASSGASPAEAPFDVDATTADRLGACGLAELTAHLWLVTMVSTGSWVGLRVCP